MKFKVRTDRRLIRANHRSQRFVLAEIEAPAARPRAGRERPPVNLAFVLDRSGSMMGAKLSIARMAVEEAIAHLKASDRFCVVVYDDQIEIVAESAPATREAKRSAVDRLESIEARGTTNLAEGWLRGCEQVAAHLLESGVNRALLLTDGLANVGLTDPDALALHAGELRRRGVATSTFGVGEDFDEMLLEAMATAGGGHFYYIARPEQIRDHMTSEVGEALEVVAREVSLEVTAPPGVEVEAISPLPAVTLDNVTTIAIGDLVSEQALELVLRLTFPYGDVGRETGVVVSLGDRDGAVSSGGRSGGDPVRVVWTYGDDASNDRQPRVLAVDRAVARQFGARAQREAARLNRSGEYVRAGEVLEATARRIGRYAGKDAELRALVGELKEESAVYAQQMEAMERKRRHFASSNVLLSRSPEGKAVRPS